MKLAFMRKMRRRYWLLLAVLVVGGVVACHLLLPRPLREVARWPNTVAARFTPLGVLRVTGATKRTWNFIQYDRQGKQRWTVQVDWKAYLPSPKEGTYAVSPDGHILAVVKCVGKQLAIFTWRDGVPLGEARVALIHTPAKYIYAGLAVMNNGQVWVIPDPQLQGSNKDSRIAVHLVQGDRTITSGSYRVKTPHPLKGFCFAYPTQDHGTFMIASYNLSEVTATEFFTLQLKGDRVVADGRLMAQPQIISQTIQQGRNFVKEDGSVYSPQGQIHPPTPEWRSVVRMPIYSPNPSAVLQYKGRGEEFRLRVYNAVTGERWMLPKKFTNEESALQYLTPSPDGRFMATLERNTYSLSEKQLEALYRLPGIGDRLSTALRKGSNTLAIYERPGKLRASRRMKVRFTNNRYSRSPRMIVSPDGRHMLFIEDVKRGQHNPEYVLYRW